MWSTTITLDNQRPSKVIVTAHNDGFSYSENLYLEKFDMAVFVQEAIAKRDKWVVDRNATLTTANAIASSIVSTLNKADKIEGIELETISASNTVSCAKKVEPIKEEMLKEM
jgi:hypothetical protein